MRLLQAKTPARWIKPQNLHMTLAFLGEVEAEPMAKAMEAACLIQSPSVGLRLDRIEYWRKPQVICLTSAQPTPAADKLAAELATRLRQAGFDLEKRPFRAHLTLARKAASLPVDARLVKPVEWKSSAFVLAESIRDAQGSHYSIIKSWPLF